MSKRILVVHNPAAGRRGKSRMLKLVELLESHAFQVSVKSTAERGDAKRAALEAHEVDVIIAAGGDGTVNEIVDGLLAREAGTVLPTVGFLPMGTANVLARELSLPWRPSALLSILEKGDTLLVRPGRANGQPFVLMASAGLDARAVASVKHATKKFLGRIAYIVAAFSALRRPSPLLKVIVDGVELEARTVIVSKSRCYGGPFRLAPGAGLEKPGLNVAVLSGHGLLAAMIYGVALISSTLHRLKSVQMLEGNSIEVYGPPDEPVQMDGDIAGTLPLHVWIEERQIPFLVPRKVLKD